MGERGRTRGVAAKCAVVVAVAVLGAVGVSGCSALRVATPDAATAAADAPTGQSGNAADAMAMLAQLPVRPLASKAGYSRSQFGRAWDDNVNVQWGHNGCDQRSDEMRSALKDVVLKPGSKCIVYSGVLDPDPYTGKVIHYIRRGREAMAIQIDHMLWRLPIRGRLAPSRGRPRRASSSRMTRETLCQLTVRPTKVKVTPPRRSGCRRTSDTGAVMSATRSR